MQSPLCAYTVEMRCISTVQVSQVYAKPTVYKYIAEIRFLITVKVYTRVCKDHCASIYCWNKIIKYNTSQHKSDCARPTVHIYCTVHMYCWFYVQYKYSASRAHCAVGFAFAGFCKGLNPTLFSDFFPQDIQRNLYLLRFALTTTPTEKKQHLQSIYKLIVPYEYFNTKSTALHLPEM